MIMTVFMCSLKIIVPRAVLAFLVLVPVNWMGETLERSKNLTFSDIDKLSISNVPEGSKRSGIVFFFPLFSNQCFVVHVIWNSSVTNLEKIGVSVGFIQIPVLPCNITCIYIYICFKQNVLQVYVISMPVFYALLTKLTIQNTELLYTSFLEF